MSSPSGIISDLGKMQLACKIEVKSRTADIRHLKRSTKGERDGFWLHSAKRVKLREGARLNFALTPGWRNGEDERLNILQWKDEEDEKFTPGGWTGERKRKGSRTSVTIGPGSLALCIQPSSSAYRDFRLDIAVIRRGPSRCVRMYNARVYRCMWYNKTQTINHREAG